MKALFLSLLLSVSSLLSAQLVGYKWLHFIDNGFVVSHSCIDKSNNIIVTGSFRGDINIDGYSISSPSDRNAIAIMKFNQSGDLLWLIKNEVTHVSAVTVDRDNNIILTGTHSDMQGTSSMDATETSFIYILKYDPSGRELWTLKSSVSVTSPPSPSSSLCIAVNNSGEILIAGRLRSAFSIGGFSFNESENSTFLFKTDASGNPLWAKSIEPINSAYEYRIIPNDLIAVDDNHYYMTGLFNGKILFGDQIIQSNGVNDIFLIKVSTDGEIVQMRAFGGKEQDEGLRLYSTDGQIFLLARFGDKITVGSRTFEAEYSYNNNLLVRFQGDSVMNSTSLGASHGGLILADICPDKDNNTFYSGIFRMNLNSYPTLFNVNQSGEVERIGLILQNGDEVMAFSSSLSSDNEGNLFVTGYFDGPVLIDGTYHSGAKSFIGQIDTSVLINSVPVNNENDGQIVVFPTITNGKIIIASVNRNLSVTIVKVYNSLGKLCASYSPASYSNEIDISNLSAGLYIMEIRGNYFCETHKVWKK